MQYIRRVDKLQSTQDLVEEIADVVIRQGLRSEKLVHICLHQRLHNVAEVRSLRLSC